MKNRFYLGSPIFSIGIYAIILLIFFREFIFSNGFLYGTDTVEAGVMFRAFLAGYFKQHFAIPLWNPYLFGGMPFADAMHGDTFFPLSFIQFIMPIHRALGWKLILAIFAGGIITYYYFRNLKFSPMVCFWGGLLYLMNSFTVSLVYAGHDGRMYVSVLFPLLLLTIDRIFRKPNFVSLFFWSISFSLLVLANHPQLAYFAMWGVGAYVVFRLIVLLTEKVDIKRAALIGTLIVCGIVIGLAGSIVQLAPQYVYVNEHSPRAEGGKGWEYAKSWSNHPEDIVSLVNPDFVGTSVGEPDTYWGRNAFKLNSDYAGFIPIVFAIIALAYVRRKYVYFFAGLGLFAIIYSVGAHTPLFKLFYNFVPQVKSFRAPSTIMFIYVFSIIYLAVHGMQYLIDNYQDRLIRRKLAKLLLIIAIVITTIAIIFSLAPGTLLGIWNNMIYSDIHPEILDIQQKFASHVSFGFWVIAALSWLVFLVYTALDRKMISIPLFITVIALFSLMDLWRENTRFIQVYPYHLVFPGNATVNYLNEQQAEGKFRVFSFPKTYDNNNFLAMHDIPQVFGYHGNQLKRYDKFTNRSYIYSYRNAEEFRDRFGDFCYGPEFDLLNVKYMAAPFNLSDNKFEAVYNAQGVFLNENKQFLPRARLVYQYEVIEDNQKAMERIRDEGFNYRNSVTLDKEPGIEVPSDTLEYVRARITDDNINDFNVRVDSPHPGILVLSENYYPAWKTEVDGEETEILLAYGNFMAIPIAAGEHMVHVEFDSPIYDYSSMLTKFTWLMYLGVIVYYILIARRRKESKDERSCS